MMTQTAAQLVMAIVAGMLYVTSAIARNKEQKEFEEFE